MKKQLYIIAFTCSALLAFTDPIKAQESTYSAWTDFESSWFPKSMTIACAKLLGDNEYGYYFRISKNLGGISIEELENNEWTKRKLTKKTDASVSFSAEGLSHGEMKEDYYRKITLSFVQSKMYISEPEPAKTKLKVNPCDPKKSEDCNPFDNLPMLDALKTWDFDCYKLN
jgi:hypothetical protein